MHMAEEEYDPPTKLITPEYYDYLDLFSEKQARMLLSSRYGGHTIPLTEEAKPPFGCMYSIPDAELKEVRK